jgi:hypothetical protein
VADDLTVLDLAHPAVEVPRRDALGDLAGVVGPVVGVRVAGSPWSSMRTTTARER